MNEGRAKEEHDALELIARFGAALCNRGIAPDNHGVFTAVSAMTLAFTQNERSQYFECLAALGQVVYDQPVGDETLRQLLDQTLLTVIDGPPEGSEQRIATAIEGLRRDLFAPATDFTVAYRIQWIAESELPFRYQHVQLIPVDPAMLSATLRFVRVATSTMLCINSCPRSAKAWRWAWFRCALEIIRRRGRLR